LTLAAHLPRPSLPPVPHAVVLPAALSPQEHEPHMQRMDPAPILPKTTDLQDHVAPVAPAPSAPAVAPAFAPLAPPAAFASAPADRKSTRLNSSHVKISYAVF